MRRRWSGFGSIADLLFPGTIPIVTSSANSKFSRNCFWLRAWTVRSSALSWQGTTAIVVGSTILPCIQIIKAPASANALWTKPNLFFGHQVVRRSISRCAEPISMSSEFYKKIGYKEDNVVSLGKRLISDK